MLDVDLLLLISLASTFIKFSPGLSFTSSVYFFPKTCNKESFVLVKLLMGWIVLPLSSTDFTSVLSSILNDAEIVGFPSTVSPFDGDINVILGGIESSEFGFISWMALLPALSNVGFLLERCLYLYQSLLLYLV